MFRKIVYISALVTFFLLFSSKAHAAMYSNSNIDFTALQKNCVIINVHLNGLQHTITCSKERTSSVTPNTGQINCALGGILQVKNYNYSGVLCFSGYGYLGVKIYSVDEVDNGSYTSPSWIRDYDPTGSTCTIETRSYTVFNESNPAYLTQIDIGDSQGPDCSTI